MWPRSIGIKYFILKVLAFARPVGFVRKAFKAIASMLIDSSTALQFRVIRVIFLLFRRDSSLRVLNYGNDVEFRKKWRWWYLLAEWQAPPLRMGFDSSPRGFIEAYWRICHCRRRRKRARFDIHGEIRHSDVGSFLKKGEREKEKKKANESKIPPFWITGFANYVLYTNYVYVYVCLRECVHCMYAWIRMPAR